MLPEERQKEATELCLRFCDGFNMGLPLFDKGFANVTVDKKFNGWTQRAGADSRLKTATGATTASPRSRRKWRLPVPNTRALPRDHRRRCR